MIELICRLALFLMVPAFSLMPGWGTAWASDAGSIGRTDTLETVARTYQIEIQTGPVFPVRTRHGAIDGKAPDQGAVERYEPLFVSEFTLYPRALVKRSKLKRVVLCVNLSFAGQRRNAIPDFEGDALYLDVERGAHSGTYLRKVIHHEFFHIIDYRDDGLLYTDEGWTKLNPRGFAYGRGGANAQGTRTTSVLTDAIPGFLNHYSTTGVEEDKAEVFANMIVDAAYVEERSRTDVVFRAKVERMKVLVSSFCPDADRTFWKTARELTRGDSSVLGERTRRVGPRPAESLAGAYLVAPVERCRVPRLFRRPFRGG